MQSRRKPFNIDTHAAHDASGKETVLRFLRQLGIDAEENPNRYGVDLLGKNIDHTWEVEKRPEWEDEWPYSTVHVPNRKEKFLQLSMIYAVVNKDLSKIMFCVSPIISECEQIEVPNTEVTWGEYFFNVPVNEWQVYDVAAFEYHHYRYYYQSVVCNIPMPFGWFHFHLTTTLRLQINNGHQKMWDQF